MVCGSNWGSSANDANNITDRSYSSSPARRPLEPACQRRNRSHPSVSCAKTDRLISSSVRLSGSADLARKP